MGKDNAMNKAKTTDLHIDWQRSEDRSGWWKLVGALKANWASCVYPREKLVQHRRVRPLPRKEKESISI